MSGSGFPLVKAQNWITNLHTDRTNPSYRHWIAEGSRNNRFVRSDMRGFGISELDPPVFDFELMVARPCRRMDGAGFEQCDLLGVAHGAPIAMAYAARHPERVRKIGSGKQLRRRLAGAGRSGRDRVAKFAHGDEPARMGVSTQLARRDVPDALLSDRGPGAHRLAQPPFRRVRTDGAADADDRARRGHRRPR